MLTLEKQEIAWKRTFIHSFQIINAFAFECECILFVFQQISGLLFHEITYLGNY